ncbi:hypothetical protein [Salinibacillus kushneri]|nr:hypothetical protein [Salinibacillus kushneri]
MDTLISFSFFLAITLTTLPIVQHIREEQYILHTRSQMVTELYNEMLKSVESYPVNKKISINHTKGTIEINVSHSITTGCITWQNVKSKQERKCFYAKKES